VSRCQKGKTNLDFTEARDSGISWAVRKSAPRSRQIATPATAQFFTGRTPFLRPNQECQSTEGNIKKVKGTVFPYSLPSVGPGADPGVQAVSPQVT